jgi:large subunit ribosomal protein L10
LPSQIALESKKQVVAQLKEKLTSAVSCVIVDYKGITVADDTKLRKELREAGVEYTVTKNTLLRFAAQETGYDALIPSLEGTTAFAISTTDQVAPARILSKYADSSDGKFVIKTGFVDGEVLSAEKITAIGKLPAKEVLIAQVLGGLNATIAGLAYAIKAIAEKKEEGGEAVEADPAQETVEAPVEAAPAEETAEAPAEA